MAELIAILSFLALAAAISYYGYTKYAKPGRVYDRVGVQIAAAPTLGDSIPAGESNAFMRVISRVGEKVPVSPSDAKLVRRYLLAAGFRSDNALRVLYGLKLALCVVLLAAASAIQSYVSPVPAVRIIILVAAAVLGWFAPGLVLESLVRRRQERIRLALPDALDLLVVCVEAGHGLDQAFVRVSRELRLTHPDICDEIGLVTLEMRAGSRRAAALHNLAERTGEAELRKLVAVLIQADRFGTSIADSLRTRADFMRIKRRQDAEERANKVGVKLVFPIFFCILPSMFVVTAGPGVVSIVTHLLPVLRNAKGLH